MYIHPAVLLNNNITIYVHTCTYIYMYIINASSVTAGVSTAHQFVSLVYMRGRHGPTNYSGTSELQTPCNPVMTLSSCCMPCIQKLSIHKCSLSAERSGNVEEWIETAEVSKNSKYFSTIGNDLGPQLLVRIVEVSVI